MTTFRYPMLFSFELLCLVATLIIFALNINLSESIKVINGIDDNLERKQSIVKPQLLTADVLASIFANVSVVIQPVFGKGRSVLRDESGYLSTFSTGGSSTSRSIHELSKIGLRASRTIMDRYGEKYENKYEYINNYEAPYEFCPYANKPYCDFSYPYRTIDGSCNNYKYTWWGKSETPFKRLLYPNYNDYLDEPRKYSVTGNKLANPRIIALKVHFPLVRSHKLLTNLFPHFSQFIDHDISLTSLISDENGKPIKCHCGSKNYDCINIPIPKRDRLNKDQKCMITPRSSASYQKFDCKLGAREQLNLLTHWLDLSQIYGNVLDKNLELRSFEHGKLNSSTIKKLKQEYLPFITDGSCQNIGERKPCFTTGDIRANQNVLLTSLQTVWMREHNRVAEILYKHYPDWNDEKLFQETRRIVIAEYQHIIYNEWLPILVGKKAARLYDLMPLNQDYFYKYDEKLYPNIANEFSTAAFRFGHTLVKSTFTKADISYRPIGQITLRKSIFNPLTTFHRGGVDSYIRGSLIDHPDVYDSHITDTLLNHLFEGLNPKIETHRFSLPALNINRGRDHGLQSYNEYRYLCGLNYAKDFKDLTNIPKTTLKHLEEVYEDVNDIDLFTGGISELPIDGGVVGPTFACIISKQFRDLKYGDRFYYENGGYETTRFTLKQLDEIRKVTFSRILCDNVNIEFIQKNPFLVSDKQLNPVINCKNFERVNLKKWYY